MPRTAGPLLITAKLGDKTYQVDLPADYNVTNTFNIGDLQICTEEQELRTILLQEGGIEPYSYPLEHGSRLGELQAVPSRQVVPTVSVQKHITKHSSLEHDENNKTRHDQDVQAQGIHDKPRDHKTYSSSQGTDQQPGCDKATLHLCLRSENTCSETSQPGIGIFAPGPSHHEPRTFLVIITEFIKCCPRCPGQKNNANKPSST